MHRTSSKNRFLKVQRETLRTLASSELRSAHGGTLRATLNGGPNCPDLIDRDVIDGPVGGQSMPNPAACPALIRDRLEFDPLPIRVIVRAP